MYFVFLYYQLFHSISNNINKNNHKFTIKITIYFKLNYLITFFSCIPTLKTPRLFFPLLNFIQIFTIIKKFNCFYMNQCYSYILFINKIYNTNNLT